MNRMSTLFLVFLAMGCKGKDAAQISIDISPVNLGVHAVDDGTLGIPPYEFDLQLLNTGDKVLTIESVSFFGDQNCHFAFEGPDAKELDADQQAFIRGTYEPMSEAEDQLVMEVVSDSEEFPTLVVPICALAVDPDDVQDTEAPECQVPPDDQPDCDE